MAAARNKIDLSELNLEVNGRTLTDVYLEIGIDGVFFEYVWNKRRKRIRVSRNLPEAESLFRYCKEIILATMHLFGIRRSSGR